MRIANLGVGVQVQTHDHENLFVVGSPTLPNAGCTNGTLTFVALTLRSAERIVQQVRRA